MDIVLKRKENWIKKFSNELNDGLVLKDSKLDFFIHQLDLITSDLSNAGVDSLPTLSTDNGDQMNQVKPSPAAELDQSIKSILKNLSDIKQETLNKSSNSNKENLNKYKRMFFKTYLDSFIPFNISDKKFDLLSESSESIIQEAEKPSSNKKRKDSNISKLTNPLDKMIFSK